MKEQTILEFTKMKLKKVEWFPKKDNGNKEKMTTDEMLKYNELKRNQNMYSIKIFIYPLYLLFWAGLYSIVYKMAFGLDFSSVFLTVISLVGSVWWKAVILVLLVVEVPSLISQGRYNKRLVEKIIKERRNRK